MVLAYRLSKNEDDGEKSELSQNHVSHKSIKESENNGIVEGYDDGNEEGCGEKLLYLLQKMGVENILIIVYVWH